MRCSTNKPIEEFDLASQHTDAHQFEKLPEEKKKRFEKIKIKSEDDLYGKSMES